jgi:hypothetical protein
MVHEHFRSLKKKLNLTLMMMIQALGPAVEFWGRASDS